MSLKGPSPEDLRKIHAEITQIVNQRFIITTFAITVFGIFAAWLIPKNNVDIGSNISRLTIVGSIVVTFLLGALYLFNLFFLRGMLRTYTTYLIVTESSGWEYDWRAYRRSFKRYLGYTKAQAGIFLLLGLISTAFPFFIALGYSLNFYFCGWLCTDIAIGVIYVLFVLLTGVFGWLNPQKKLMERWEKLKNDKEATV